ncbi:MAG TPA: acetylglutamate kinase [Clostridiales bacterium]|nr:acetylglutamate kinase [Clostridiales bacterium]
MLWEQHSVWTRAAIVSLVFELPNTDAVLNRLLRNPVDFENVFRLYYGDRIAAQFKDLLTEHLVVAADIVNAAKAGNNQAVEEAERIWYANADAIAALLGRINPYWSQQEWRAMLREHLALVNAEAVSTLTGDYEATVTVYDQIEMQALRMADVMSMGIIRQFGVK